MTNFYNRATFELSVAAIKQLPPEQGYEVAFAGRSNAGKSSAINALTGHRSLARTSKTPGRTQHLNFFRLDEQRALVDLPGYGYAKVPESVKRQWYELIDNYLSNRQILSGIILIMDVRHPFGRSDQQIIDWAVAGSLPLHVLLSKADKIGNNQRVNTLRDVRKQLASLGIDTSTQLFSATKPIGLEELRATLDGWLHVGD